jgi:hypothetical protein
MPFGEVALVPGVNVERTPTLNQAAISQSQLIRFKDGLAQKYGGWQRYYPNALSGTPRDMHAWEDLNEDLHLSVGTTSELYIFTDNLPTPITPQTLVSDFVPGLQGTAGSTTITITDPNISNVTVYDAVLFNTPVYVGGALISGGPYPITQINGASEYEITIPNTVVSTNTLTTSSATSSGSTLTFSSVPASIFENMQIVDLTTSGVIPAGTHVVSTTMTTVVMSNSVTGGGVGDGDSIVFTFIPAFATTNGTSTVDVYMPGHPFTTTGVGQSYQVNFPLSTTVGGITVDGTYTITGVVSNGEFQILGNNNASSSTTAWMNGGKCELVYYIQIGPPSIGSGYGVGGYGDGGYGSGAAASSTQTGDPITATDYTQDNWGEVLLSCPAGGGIYAFDPTQGFQNSGIIATAPAFNTGIFVSTATQILIAYGATIQLGVGQELDPLTISWSDQGNYTVFTPLKTNQAGSYRLPTGSKIITGGSVFNQDCFWTDIDMWVGNYIGQPYTFGFNKVGSGCGAVSSHSFQTLQTGVYWMGQSNFYSYTGTGVQPITCPVWDFVFQNLNTAYLKNVRAMPNSNFNEVGWLFPSAASSNGECDSYVKFNVAEPNAPWDYGSLPRSAWMDESILGPPIGANPGGIVYQHETTNDADGTVLAASFSTGYFFISEGEDFAFVDQIYPDFRYGFFGQTGANIQITPYSINYENDTPVQYPTYTVSANSPAWISTRIRGRQMSFTIASNDIGSFWRIGKCRYRFSPDGRR